MNKKCPACDHELSIIKTKHYEIDACVNSCGGIWFDKEEIWQVDEQHEEIPVAILKIAERNSAVRVDPKKIKACPVCTEQVLARQFFDINNQVEIDLCWQCGGLWLDPGEINLLRKQHANYQERVAIADQYVSKIIADTSATLNLETKEKIEDYNKRYSNRLTSFLSFFKALISKNHTGDIDTI